MVEGVPVFFSQCVLTMYAQYLSRLEDFSQFRVNVIFLGKFFHDLTLDKHCRCFRDQGGVPQICSERSQELEVVDFNSCSQIPAAAWHCVPSGAWPKLQYSWGISVQEKRRLRGDAVD